MDDALRSQGASIGWRLVNLNINKGKTMKYALFKEVEFEKESAGEYLTFASVAYLMRPPPVEGEEWKEEDGEKPKTKLVFVAMLDSPKDIVKHVQKNPKAKFVVLEGEFKRITVAMPVFIEGKNVSTMDREWS